VQELSDEKIMLLVKEGHLSELTELFERYHVKLFNFFWRLTLEKATSEDLTQNLFYRVIKYRQSYQPGNGSFRSWIYRMARNVYIDFCKQAQKIPDRPGSREDIADNPDREMGAAGGWGNSGSGRERWEPGAEGYSEEQYEKLDRAMAGLQPEQREIIVLSRFQGLKYEEIARIKEISVPAIKVQVHRAIKHLRNLYFSTSTGGDPL
jgi:RNA polymerase sigma factor (sigma-70 family)